MTHCRVVASFEDVRRYQLHPAASGVGVPTINQTSPNKTGYPVAEAMERRAGTKGNADQQSTHRTQIRARVTQALGRVRQADQASPSNTQGRSRMLESGSSGSVRGVLSNEHPYREPGPEGDIQG